MIPARFIAIAVCAAAMPAGAAVLYKSVDAKGVVTFSDMPPDRGVDAKTIVVPESSSAVPGASRERETIAAAPTRDENLYAGDQAVLNASLQVDMAEHALAVARRPVWEIADPMKLSGPRLTRSDQERIDHYRKNLKIAQQQLADVLRSRRKAAATQTMTAEAGAPIYGASSPIYRR
jgi:hypothetical protein